MESILLPTFLLAAVASAQGPSVSFTPSPNGAGAAGISDILSPSFAGVGIEPSNLYSFTGFEQTNVLSVNCLHNLANYTGVPPYIRLGGNTQDYMIYAPKHQEYNLAPNPNPIGQGAYPSDSLIFGPKYFEVFDRFPTGTPTTFGLNLAYDGDKYGGYLNHIASEAEAARTQFKNVQLQAFEIGNEPDLYLENGFRTGDWSGTVYGEQWAERAKAVWTKVLQPNGMKSNFFEPGTTASTIGTSFEIEMLANSAITGPAPGSNAGYVSAWSQHDYYYYISVSTYALTLDMMMDLSTTVSQFDAWVTQVKQADDTPFPYVLREMASVGPVGQVGISDTFGAALFTLNFFLYTAGLGIKSVEFHMTDTSYAAPWQPIKMDIFHTPPHVRPSYSAWAVMAQLIGTGCNTRLVGLPVSQYPTGYESRLAAYTTYVGGNLDSLVMLNTKQANSTQPKKNRASFNFNLPDMAGEVFYLSYMTAPGADSTMGTTWNGMSYSESGDGTPTMVNDIVDSVRVPNNGQLTINVRDSQAIVAHRGNVLGTNNNIRNSNCDALAGQVPLPQGEADQQQYPLQMHTAAGAASPSGYNNYNANGQASGANPRAQMGNNNGGDGGSKNGAASVSTPVAASIAMFGALIGGAAFLL